MCNLDLLGTAYSYNNISFLNTFLLPGSMSRQDKIQMPSSGAGITRYFDDYKSKFQLKPGHVIILTVLIVIVVIVLHLTGKAA
jgi:preprotein translocase subunit Sec61beta